MSTANGEGSRLMSNGISAGSVVLQRTESGSSRFVSRAAQVLEALDAQVDAIYELLPFGSYRTDSKGTILSINDPALALLGRERKQLVGGTIPIDCFTPRSREHFEQLSMSHDDRFDDCKLSLYGRDGTIRQVLLSGRLVGVPAGSARSRRFVIVDITKNKPRRSDRAVDVLCSHIAAGGTTQLGSEEMAAVTGMTFRALSYAFRERFGCTPTEWQRNHFLDLAHQYLSRGDVSASVKVVAKKFGFTSTASFSKFYRRRFGHHPGKTGQVEAPAMVRATASGQKRG